MDFGNWDKEFNLTDYISLLPRVLKENSNVVIFNAWENLGEIANVCREFNITPKRCLVLSKSNPAPFNRDRMFVNDVEFAIWEFIIQNRNLVSGHLIEKMRLKDV